MTVLRDGRELPVRLLAEGEEPPPVEDGKSVRQRVDRAKAEQQSRADWKPAPDHPWRRQSGHDRFPLPNEGLRRGYSASVMRSRLDEIKWTNHTNPEHLGLLEAEYDARLARLEVTYDRLETKASGILRVALTLGGILFGFLLVEGSQLACEIRWAFQAAVLLLVVSGFLASRAMAVRPYVAVGMLPRTDEQVRALDKWLKSPRDPDVSYAIARLQRKAEAVVSNTDSNRTKTLYVKWAVRVANAVIPVSFLVWMALRTIW